MKLKDFSLVIYTESLEELQKAYGKANLVATQKNCAQIILVFNSASQLPKHLEAEKNSISCLEILEIKDTLSQGAALNKALPFISGNYTLFLEQACCSYLPFLDSLESAQVPSLPSVILSLPLSEDKKSFYHPYQQSQRWPQGNLTSLYFIPWGAFFLSTQYLFSLGGFDERFHRSDMLLVLSMKAHQHQGVLLQVDQPEIEIVPFHHSPAEFQQRLAKKYFGRTLSFFDKFKRWLGSLQSKPPKNRPLEKKHQHLMH